MAVETGSAPWEAEGIIREAPRQLRGWSHVQSIGPVESRKIVVHGPLDPTTFDRLHIVYATTDSEWAALRVDVIQKLQVVGSASQRLRLQRQGKVSLDLPGNRTLEGPIDQLILRLPAEPIREFSVAGLLLSRRDLVGGWFPESGEDPRLITIGKDTRRAVSLDRRRPLEYSVNVPPNGALQLAVGTPEAGGRAVGRAHVAVSCEDEDGRVLIERQAVAESMAWSLVRLDLTMFQGESLRVRVALESDSEEELAVLVEPPVLYRESPRPPTVLLVTSDTHRADHLGMASRSPGVETPVLDELARGGIFFEDCYASAQSTSPSHASLMTGVSPLENGVLANGFVLSEEANTLAERFQEAGYLTYGVVSATHLAHRSSGLGKGFDRLAAPAGGQRDSEETWNLLQEWLGEAPAVPLFVWLHLFDAHSPYDPPAELAAAYWEGGDPRRPELPRLKSHQAPKWDRSIRDVDYLEAMYRGEVHYVDLRMGTVLAHPRFAEALVAVTADHGEVLRTREDRHWFGHSPMIHGTLHVPLILKGPGVPSGRRASQGVLQIDVGRTLLDLSGLEDAPFPGRSLLEERDSGVRFALGSHGRIACARLDRWLLSLLLLPRDKSQAQGFEHRVELFDLEADPGCLRDLAEVETRISRPLRELLIEWLQRGASSGDGGASPLMDEGLQRELQALGYTADGSPAPSEFWDPACECPVCEEYREGPAGSVGPR